MAAVDKASGKSEKITITNDKGRLSQEEIDRMVSEAEEFAEADKKVKGRVDARNQLETYCYNMKQVRSVVVRGEGCRDALSWAALL